MDPTLYKTAVEGNSGDGDSLLFQLKRDEELGYQVTPKGNTVLHVAALHGHSDLPFPCHYYIVRTRKMRQHFTMQQKNGMQKWSACYSAKETRKKLLRMTDYDGDTALNKAVRNQHVDVVKLLVKEEDPEFVFPANFAEETPLCMA